MMVPYYLLPVEKIKMKNRLIVMEILSLLMFYPGWQGIIMP
jgi:hypothetical protein